MTDDDTNVALAVETRVERTDIIQTQPENK